MGLVAKYKGIGTQLVTLQVGSYLSILVYRQNIFNLQFIDLGNILEHFQHGGERVLTFMIYLNSVEEGGSTVFPQPGIAIKPTSGKALLWFNVGPQHHFDSRTFHLGCPVLYGNKWITTKWHRWISSYRTYPCYKDKKHFSIFDDDI